jgi:hypothetical protein
MHAPLVNDRRCAWGVDGRFRDDNYACETLLELRDIAEFGGFNRCFHNRDDESAGSIAVVHIPEIVVSTQGWIVMTFYKSRGCTHSATLLNDNDKPTFLAREYAEEVCVAYERAGYVPRVKLMNGAYQRVIIL